MKHDHCGRLIAIGDIHGCARALEALLSHITPRPEDTLVQLGDLVDRGPNSRAVIEEMIALSSSCRVVVILGDHEEMLLDAVLDTNLRSRWYNNGGRETLKSYGCNMSMPGGNIGAVFPKSHLDFLSQARQFYETDQIIFVHAGYVPNLAMPQQPGLALRWRVCNKGHCQPHFSGKKVVVGHTAQRSGEILDLGFLTCIDTNCVRGGWLTALDTSSGRVWQVNRDGRIR